MDSQVWNMATKDHGATGDADDGKGDHWEARPPRTDAGAAPARMWAPRDCPCAVAGPLLFARGQSVPERMWRQSVSSGRRCDAGGGAVDWLPQAMGSANSSGLGGLTDADIGEANALVQPRRAASGSATFASGPRRPNPRNKPPGRRRVPVVLTEYP